MSESTKGGNIILRSVNAPDSVRPGESFEVEALVSNGAAYINPWDGDKCGLAPPGYKLNVVFRGPDGQQDTVGPVCHTTTEVGTREETYSTTFQAPDSGRPEVSAKVVMENSGKETNRVSDVVQVSEREPEEPDPYRDDNSGDNAPDPSGDGSGNPFGGLMGSLGDVQSLVILGGVALLALYLIEQSDDYPAVREVAG